MPVLLHHTLRERSLSISWAIYNDTYGVRDTTTGRRLSDSGDLGQQTLDIRPSSTGGWPRSPKTVSPLLKGDDSRLFCLSPIEMAVEMDRKRVIEEFILDGLVLNCDRAIQLSRRAFHLGHKELIVDLYRLSLDKAIRLTALTAEDIAIQMNKKDSPFAGACEDEDIHTAKAIIEHIGNVKHYIYRAIEKDFIELIEWAIPIYIDMEAKISTANGHEVHMIDASVYCDAVMVLASLITNTASISLYTIKIILCKKDALEYFDYLMENRSEETICMLKVSLKDVLSHEYSNVFLHRILCASDATQMMQVFDRIMIIYESSRQTQEEKVAKLIPIIDLYIYCMQQKRVEEGYAHHILTKLLKLDMELYEYMQTIYFYRYC